MTRFKYLWAVVLGVLLGGVVYTVVFPKKAMPAKGQSSPPEVMSCVKNVKVTNRRIDEALNRLVVEVENTGDLSIVSISLESKKGKAVYTVRNSTFEADEPTVVIKPHERHELEMELANIAPKAHLQIGSVTYSDGTEDGCEESVQATRKSKTYHEEIKAQRKGPK